VSDHIDQNESQFARCYQLFRAQIEHEDGLLNQRVTWVVTSQAFLLGTYVFLVNSPSLFLEIMSPQSNSLLPGSSNLYFNVRYFSDSVNSLRSVFQIIGVFSSVATCVSSMAAVMAISHLARRYRKILTELYWRLRCSRLNSVEQDQNKLPTIYRLNTSNPDESDVVKHVHEVLGLPDLVSRRPTRIMGLVASIFFGIAFTGAWMWIILQEYSIVVNLNVTIGLPVLIAVPIVLLIIFLLWTLSNWDGKVKNKKGG
jgi:hypothetical protein